MTTSPHATKTDRRNYCPNSPRQTRRDSRGGDKNDHSCTLRRGRRLQLGVSKKKKKKHSKELILRKLKGRSFNLAHCKVNKKKKKPWRNWSGTLKVVQFGNFFPCFYCFCSCTSSSFRRFIDSAALDKHTHTPGGSAGFSRQETRQANEADEWQFNTVWQHTATFSLLLFFPFDGFYLPNRATSWIEGKLCHCQSIRSPLLANNLEK